MDDFYRWDRGDLILQIKVRPNARTFAWGKVGGGHVVMHVPAAPENGRATARLLRLLANECAVPLAQVQLIRGEFSPHKIVRIIAPRKIPGSVALPPEKPPA